MPETFSRVFPVGWADMDSNAHMRNTAYLDRSADVRMMYFEAHGFPIGEFERLRIGPVVRRDELEYYREMRLLEKVTVSLKLAGMSPDGARFRLRNEFFREDGRMVARVTSIGGWLDLNQRKLTTPPPKVAELFGSLERTDDFEDLP